MTLSWQMYSRPNLCQVRICVYSIGKCRKTLEYHRSERMLHKYWGNIRGSNRTFHFGGLVQMKKNLRWWRRFSQQKEPRIFYVSFSVQMVSVLSP